MALSNAAFGLSNDRRSQAHSRASCSRVRMSDCATFAGTMVSSYSMYFLDLSKNGLFRRDCAAGCSTCPWLLMVSAKPRRAPAASGRGAPSGVPTKYRTLYSTGSAVIMSRK